MAVLSLARLLFDEFLFKPCEFTFILIIFLRQTNTLKLVSLEKEIY